MDNEQIALEKPVPGLPKNKVFTSSAPVVPSTSAPSTTLEDSDRNSVFRHLVKEDADIAGLVAYSIYKQNKLDWLTAFEAAKGRAPNDAELASYIIGEGTPRRLATYRHLAEATLAGHGPDVEGGGSRTITPFRRGGGSIGSSAPSPILVGIYVLIAILFVIGFWFAAHYTMASR